MGPALRLGYHREEEAWGMRSSLLVKGRSVFVWTSFTIKTKPRTAASMQMHADLPHPFSRDLHEGMGGCGSCLPACAGPGVV